MAVFLKIVFSSGRACSLDLKYPVTDGKGIKESGKYFVRQREAREVEDSYGGLQKLEDIWRL